MTTVSVLAIPDFVAGLAYGLTGENNLIEIESCYDGGVVMEQEIVKGIADIKAGGWDYDVQAALEFGLVALQVPQALSTCKGMDDDLAAIKDWASIFTDPAKLSAKVASHYALHRKAINADIAALESDFGAGSFFKAGQDAADLLTLAIGPIKPDYPAASMPNFSVAAVPDFAAGFLYGFVGDNHLAEVEACWTGGEQFVADAEAALALLEAGDVIKATKAFKALKAEFQGELSTCENLQDDMAALDAWDNIFTEPVALAETVGKHWLLHKHGIKKDIAAEKADWSAGSYFKAGVDTADAFTLLLGPVEEAPKAAMPSFSIAAVPDFAAGFIYGFAGDNNLAEVEACWTGGEQFVADAEAALALLEAGDIIKATKAFKALKSELHGELATCENLQDDMAALDAWDNIFTEPVTLAETVGKHWLLHKRAIKKDIASEKADWSAGDYFKAGVDTADAFTLLLGPVEEAPKAIENFSVMAVPDFLAGLIYGFTGDNELPELEACYQGGSELATDAETLLHELEAGDFFHASKTGIKLKRDLSTDLALCSSAALSDDFAAIEAWADIFTEPVKLSETVAKNWLLHKRGIKKDISQEESDWSAGNYFNAGVDTADALVKLLGPVE